MRSYIVHALPTLQKLNKTIDRHCETGAELRLQPEKPLIIQLRKFLNDACRFLTHSTTWVPHWPLQLYFLAIELEPGDSAIRETFYQIVRDRFGPLPAVVNISQSQKRSLPLRTTTFTRRQDGSIHHHYPTFSPGWHSQRVGNKRPIITSWVIKKGRRELDFDDLTKTPKEITEHLESVGTDMEDGLDLECSNHFMCLTHENVMEDARNGSSIHYKTLDLSQGPYQGLNTFTNSEPLERVSKTKKA